MNLNSARALAGLFLLLQLAVIDGHGGMVAWDGGGGNFSWQTAANWSGDTLPGTNDDVVINMGGNITVTSSAGVIIRSLQCSNHLALSAGTFRVTGGDSVIQGNVFVTGSPVVSATGPLTHFALLTATNVDGLAIEAVGGARVSLPALAAYNKVNACTPVTWQAVGPTSVLELPALTNLVGSACTGMTLQALGGGNLLVSHLATLSEGFLTVLADGTNSVLDLTDLRQSYGAARTISFEARNQGAILMPQFAGGENVFVTVRIGGSLPFEQLTELSGLTVSGTNANFNSLTTLTTGNITVNSSAIVTAPNLVSHVAEGCPLHDWLVTGVGSVLDFSNLTNVSGPSCGWLNFKAMAGGTFILTNLAVMGEGTVNVTADGTNSLVDLSGLRQTTAASRVVTFNASNDGTIRMPQFFGGAEISVTLASGGRLPVEQFRQLLGFSVTGMRTSFDALTDLGGGNVNVNGGAVVTLPSLSSHSEAGGCFGNTWLVSGAGSLLDLPALSMLTGASCGFHNFSATAGGQMNLSRVSLVSDGFTMFSADGSGSVLDLSALAGTAGAHTVTFAVSNGGALLAPLLTGNTNVAVTLQSGGVFPAGQMQRLLGFTVNGMAAEFTGLTNLSAGNVTVNNGGVATAPQLQQYVQLAGCAGATWLATGAGSVLDFSSLTNITGPGCGFINVNATAGGHARLGQVATLGDGLANVLADGTNSQIDLSSLTLASATTYPISFTAQNGGVILVPVLQGGETLAVAIKSGGSLDTGALRLLKSLTVSGTPLNLPGITNLFAGDLTVDQGAVLSLPSLFNHNQRGVCAGSTWSVTGSGSKLDLSSMTNLTGANCGFLNINALAGGCLNLSHLLTITDGTLSFLADGSNSLIDLSQLQRSLATSQSVAFEARNWGTISMPQMSGGSSVSVTIKTNGVLSTAPLQTLGGVTVLALDATFDSLTNLDGGSLTLAGGGTLNAPGLVTYAKGSSCLPAAWLASGAGSVLALSGLSQLTGGSCAALSIIATNGGVILLGNLGAIPSGSVSILSTGAGSQIDLHSLSNYLHTASLSKLTTTNSGSIQLNDQPLFLSGVTVNLAAGTPGLPTALMAPTNLILHGHAWSSYWVEQRDTSLQLNPWSFFRRVPLTNDFQVIGAIAGVNKAFRGWEFTADPFALELSGSPSGVQAVLYGPISSTLEVQMTTNLAKELPWPLLETVVMTNTFHILPSNSSTNPQNYFRVIPL